ncbi:MAG: RNA polymerase sigma factor [candidate division WOR-3 bacterium]
MLDDLLERAKEGDESAVAKIYENYRSLIYAYAFKVFKNQDDAEEVVARTFEKFLTFLPSLKSGNLAGWLFIVAKNEIAEIHRERTKEESLEAMEKSPPRESSPANPNPEDLLLQKRDWEELVKALLKLPKDYERVLILYYLEGYEVKEIAQKLGKSEDMVWQIISRAKKKFKNALKHSSWLRKRYKFIGGKDEGQG